MKAFLINQEKGNIIEISDEKSTKILFLGLEDFRNNIVDGNCCFICAAENDSKPFNDEHIIPNWVLRKYDLHAKNIILPNDRFLRYGQYTVPCCQECNTRLGELIEHPISRLFEMDYENIIREVKEDNDVKNLIFQWLCLIYLKTHLKDTTNLVELDRRKNAGRIADNYDWAGIHHIHCMARVHYTDAKVRKNVYGSLIIAPSLVTPQFDGFDYMDSLGAKVVMIQLGTVLIYGVLNDSGYCSNIMKPILQKITGPLTPFQSRQVFAHLCYCNLNLNARPKYQSTLLKYRDYVIKAILPRRKVNVNSKEKEIVSFGELLHFYIDKIFPDEIENRLEMLQEIKNETRNYLFNEKGDFIQHNQI